ncbi:MAG: hypothetical protein WEB06_11650 [Actinomycetota bacterium]
MAGTEGSTDAFAWAGYFWAKEELPDEDDEVVVDAAATLLSSVATRRAEPAPLAFPGALAGAGGTTAGASGTTGERAGG